ncbi:hypothetical protein BH20GEM2_BH20GEM2_12850 [soil metagenome]
MIPRDLGGRRGKGSRRAVLLPVARVWWVVTRRRWRDELHLLIFVGWFVAAVAYQSVRIAAAPEAAAFTGLALLAGAAALLLPAALSASSLPGAARWELLPYTPRWMLLLRTLFAQPLRVLLCGCGLTGVSAALLLLELGPLRTGLEWVQLAGWGVAAWAATEVLEDALARRQAIVLRGLLGLGGAIALSLITRYDLVLGRMAATNAPTPTHTLLLGSRGAIGVELLLAVGAMAAATGAVLLVGRRAERRAEPPPIPRALPLFGRFIATLTAIAVPGARAGFGKEIASVLRWVRISSGLLWPFLIALVAFARGVPWLLIAAPLVWTMHSYNLLGVDLPLGGLTRYRLLPRPLGRTLALRHGAMLLLTTVSVLLAAAVVLAFDGLRILTRGAEALLYPVAYLYGTSLFLLFTPVGDRLSFRFPCWLDLRWRRRLGRPVSSVTWLLATLAVTGAAGVIFAAASVSAAGIFTANPARITTVLIFASCTHIALYAAGIRSWYRHR